MTLEVETVVAVSLMMAVFSAVAAVGTSIVLGAGFERLRSGFEVVRKQTGFFSDAIHKLEQKVEDVDKQTDQFSANMQVLEKKVSGVGEQAGLFSESMQKLEKKVDIVDKQTAFFSDAIHKLEQKVDTVDMHEQVIQDKLQQHSDVDLISTAKTDAMVSRAEDLLMEVSALNAKMLDQMRPGQDEETLQALIEPQSLHIPKGLTQYVLSSGKEDGSEIRLH